MEWIALLGLPVAVLVALLVRQRRLDAARQRSRDSLVRRLTERANPVAEERGPAPVTIRPAGRFRIAFEAGSASGSADARFELPYERCAAADPSGLLAGAAHLLGENPSSHDEPLVLRQQGRDIAPLLVRSSWLAAFPAEAEVPSTPLGDTGLAAIYRLTSHPGLRFLTARALAETGITVTDLHGAVEAMLRQRLDEDAVRRAVQGDVVEIEDEPRSAAAGQLFVVCEELAPDEELLAAVATADRVALAPIDAAEDLVRWLATQTERQEPLCPRPLRVTASGVTLFETPPRSS